MKKNNKQLYISRCMVDMKHERCSDYKRCSHTKPHEYALQCCYSLDLVNSSCCCIPVPLEYYIKGNIR